MKKVYSIHPVVVFVFAQLAWLSLLGIWIYWYVSNYIIFKEVDNRISPHIVPKTWNIVALVLGIVLLVAILVGMYLIFIYLNRQRHVTKMYDNFIANISHELKSPLASIQLYLETMKRRTISKAREKEFVDLMLQDTDRLKSLINSILDISAFEQKKIAHTFVIYNADSVFQEIISESLGQFKVSSNDFSLEGNTPSKCVIDKNAMKIVINNLIDNAVKYSVNGLDLKFKISNNKKYVVVKMSDSGIGIPRKQMKKVFRKFHRVYDKKIPNVRGTGLGLYWVREIIKYHGGKVNVKSDGWNKGTTFTIELPIYGVSKKGFHKKILKRTQKKNK